MIRDLSQTLRSLLTQGVPAELATAQIVFDRPSEQFNPTQATIDLFLYDIRENVELRNNEPTVERLNGQATIRRPPLRINCSYLVTAWPGGVSGDELALQEHRLLSQVLQVLVRYPTIPEPFLQGSLLEQSLPLPIVTAQAEGLKSPSEFWTAMGKQLRPTLNVVVTLAIPPLSDPEIVPLVITRDFRLGEKTSAVAEQMMSATVQQFFRIGGRVTDASGQPVGGATVMLVEHNLTAIADADGQYSLGAISAGTYTLRLQSETLIQESTISIPATTNNHYDVQINGE